MVFAGEACGQVAACICEDDALMVVVDTLQLVSHTSLHSDLYRSSAEQSVWHACDLELSMAWHKCSEDTTVVLRL